MSSRMSIYFLWLFGEYNVHQDIFIVSRGSVVERDKGAYLGRLLEDGEGPDKNVEDWNTCFINISNSQPKRKVSEHTCKTSDLIPAVVLLQLVFMQHSFVSCVMVFCFFKTFMAEPFKIINLNIKKIMKIKIKQVVLW